MPLAVTDCLNFGSPENPEVMWQFAQAVAGLADGCLELGIPVTGGNVSFYNQTGDVAIHPTPVVGVLGVIDDVARRMPIGVGGPRATTIYLLGDDARRARAARRGPHVVHGHLGGLPPAVDLAAERAARRAARRGVARRRSSTAAHDVSDGGLAQALVEMALRDGVGATVRCPRASTRSCCCSSESTARAVVTVAGSDVEALTALAAAHGVPVTRLGEVSVRPTSW